MATKAANIPFLRLQQSAGFYCEGVEGHLQFRYGLAEFGMGSDFLLQFLKNLVGAGYVLGGLS